MDREDRELELELLVDVEESESIIRKLDRLRSGQGGELELELFEACESMIRARMQEAGLTEAVFELVLLKVVQKGLRDPVIAARSRELDYEIYLMTKRGLSNKQIVRNLLGDLSTSARRWPN